MLDQINDKAKELKGQGHSPTHVIFDYDTYEEFKKGFYPEDRTVNGAKPERPEGANLTIVATEAGDLDVVVVPGEQKFGFQIGISF